MTYSTFNDFVNIDLKESPLESPLSPSEFYEKFKDRELHKIPIAGTHDTAAYQLINGHNNNKWLKLLDKTRSVLGCVDRIAKDWSLTQHLDIVQQLRLGIRLFDIRIMYDVDQKDFFLAHTLLCIKADDFFNAINDYLNKNPEVHVVFAIRADINNSHTFTSYRSVQFENKLNSIFGNKFIPQTITSPPSHFVKTKYLFPKLKDCIEQRQQVLCLYDSKFDVGNKNFWSFEYINTKWFPTQSDEELYQSIKKFVQKTSHSSNNHRINYISLTMSPNKKRVKKDVIKRIFLPSGCCYTPENLYRISQSKQNFLERLIQEGVNVSQMTGWLADFPSLQFIRTIAKLAS